MVPTALALHDMSGFGRCALTVVIPILSSLGIQTVPVPTAVLSTHTGGFSDFAYVDMTDYMMHTLNHYKNIDLHFDCIYSGYLGNDRQTDIVADFIRTFGDCLVVVDPAFADDGKLYSTVSNEMVEGMRNLVRHADVVTPNFTEAAYLLGKPIENEITQDEAEKWIIELSDKGPEFSVITGIPVLDNKMLTIGHSKSGIQKIMQDRVKSSYPGCGDILASCLTGKMLLGNSFEKSLTYAADFVSKSIQLGIEQGNPVRNGLPFEQLLK